MKVKIVSYWLFLMFICSSCSDYLSECEGEDSNCTTIVTINAINTINNSVIDDMNIYIDRIRCSLFYTCEFTEEKNEVVEPGSYAFQYNTPCDLEIYLDADRSLENYLIEFVEVNDVPLDSTCNDLVRLVQGSSYEFDVLITPTIILDFTKSTSYPDSLTSMQIDALNIDSDNINDIEKVRPIGSYEMSLEIVKNYSDGTILIDTTNFNYFESSRITNIRY